MKRLFLLTSLLITILVKAQVGVGTTSPDPSAMLDITSSDKGLLLPRVQINSISDVTTIPNPTAGLVIYVPAEFTETIAGVSYTRPDGIYVFDGAFWGFAHFNRSTNGSSNPGAVKINVNQSNPVVLQGSQAWGLLCQNAGVSVNPTYVTGNYPVGNSSPTDILKTSGSGADDNLLLEAPTDGSGNFFRLNMEYVMGNNPPAQTRVFYIEIQSVGSGAVVYRQSVIVPGGLNTGHVVPFSMIVPTIADAASIGVGYRVFFRVDTAGSTGLPNEISVEIVDIVRITN